MARDPASDAAAPAVLALHRFGLGPRPGSIAAIAADPRGALLAELERPGIGRVDDRGLLTSAASSRAALEARAERRAQNIVAERARKAVEQQAKAMDGAPSDAAKPEIAPEMAARAAPGVTPERQMFLKELSTKLDAAFDAEIGFAERLVWFWSNHFCVSRSIVPNMAGAYEREAIRPNVLGRFADMLLAVESHPAMLVYLDNATSMGPNSTAGINRTRGLNENLARECLELHTLGVRSVYSQEDIIRFAKVLTGWSVIPVATDPEHGGEFVFVRRFHEPGPQEVIGNVYADTGVEQGRSVLADLARHPATATHVATKLARHFIADEPPPALVERLATTFRDTDGNLKQVARALIVSDEAWTAPRNKLKKPGEWIVAMMRAAAQRIEPERFQIDQAVLGEPMWLPPAPQGFPDDEATWIDGMGRRLDVANNFAERAAERVDPGEIVDTALGPLASAETRSAVARAESRAQALALAFMSPEFQRR